MPRRNLAAGQPAGISPASEARNAERGGVEENGSFELLLPWAVGCGAAPGFRGQDAKLVLAGFVDTSGYAADLAEKYQGFLITEVKLDIEGAELRPGQYGFGFTKGGKFVAMDVGANDLLSVSSKRDEDLKRPVPLKLVEDGGVYKLYAGKSWVSLKVK